MIRNVEVGCNFMQSVQGKHFSITDPKEVNTVIYKINKTEKEYLKESPKYTVERLDYMEELRGDLKKKTFFVDNPSPDRRTTSNPFIWKRKSSCKHWNNGRREA